MKTPCGVVKDLLPLYCDGVCSGESKSLVEGHLEECGACREEYQKLRENEMDLARADEEQKKLDALKQVKKRLRMKRVAAAILAVMVFAIACTGAGMWMNVATIDVDIEGLVESVEYDPTPAEWTKSPEAIEETDLTREQIDHWGGRLKLHFSQDWKPDIGFSYSVRPVKVNGKTQTVLICSIRQSVWEYLTQRDGGSLKGNTFEVDVGGPAWPDLFSEPNGYVDWGYAGENGYRYVNEGFYTKEELEGMRLEECVVDALYYLPYSNAKKFFKLSLSPEEASKTLTEKGSLLWSREG